jgi:hypothetical protein
MEVRVSMWVDVIRGEKTRQSHDFLVEYHLLLKRRLYNFATKTKSFDDVPVGFGEMKVLMCLWSGR